MTRPAENVPSFSRDILDVETYSRLKRLVAPHVESFNYLVDYGLDESVADMQPVDIDINEDYRIKLEVLKAEVGLPTRYNAGVELPVTPKECRESHRRMTADVRVHIYGPEENAFVLPISLGDLPIMVMSKRCRIHGLSPEELVRLREEEAELGGYFLIKGIERCIRLLQVQRRNYPMAIERSNYRNRGANYSDKGIAMRCVRKDQSSITNTLHYLTNGSCTIRFVLRKQEFLLPFVLICKCLLPLTDEELYARIIQNNASNTFLTTRVELLIRDFRAYNLYTTSQCRAYVGALFRNSIPNISSAHTDEEVGVYMLTRYICVHVEGYGDKVEVLIFMLRKLYAFAEGRCTPDNTDSFSHHELLLPGHLIGMYVKEKVEEGLLGVKQGIMKDLRTHAGHLTTFLHDHLHTQKYYTKLCERNMSSVGNKVGSFLSTGNIVTSTGLDLMQVSGYTIVAEKLNYLRYLSHFQSVHRGQFFTTMKTTTVRKLLPDSWGFLCPVHTPDGGPCGLLNHLAGQASVLCYPIDKKGGVGGEGAGMGGISTDGNGDGGALGVEVGVLEKRETVCSRKYIQSILTHYGMLPGGANGGDGNLVLRSNGSSSNVNADAYISVLLDGVPLGYVPLALMDNFLCILRTLKRGGLRGGEGGKHLLEPSVELAYIPPMSVLAGGEGGSGGGIMAGAYPGLHIFTSPCRMVRPVYNLQLQCVEYVGALEQVYMPIATLHSDLQNGNHTYFSHLELSPRSMLSQVAQMTPYSDYNQSPRNMYQCQMGKQTMGTPSTYLKTRTDNKLYRILHTQAPLVQTETQSAYKMDSHPQGCNAVVCVISFTGYDMEDAMIINKASFQRGFGYGYVYKTKVIDLEEEEKRVGGKGGEGGVAYRPRLRFRNIRVGSTEVVLSSPQKKTTRGDKDGDDGVSGERVAIGEEKYCDALDLDGLPPQGLLLKYGDPLCVMMEDGAVGGSGGGYHVIAHKEKEDAYVEQVRLIGGTGATGAGTRASAGNGGEGRKVSITLRFVRKPVIGDKFSSRHGQKGTLSVLWPQENMPFSESGMVPDVLINPHAFPSRMTIGMLVESMAGKAGSLNGNFVDASPFAFHEGGAGGEGSLAEGTGEAGETSGRVIDYVGSQLLKSGYSYYGSEPLYNGITGEAMHVDIFMGVVFYQRLRHMVSDKSQVRSTGLVNAITKQPVKGRKKGGGIRLGEMERDSLLSHGVSFCLQDRLMNCSDSHLAQVCMTCGGINSVYNMPIRGVGGGNMNVNANAGIGAGAGGAGGGSGMKTPWKPQCRVCKERGEVRNVQMPYVYRYLANELAGMGIRLALTISD